MHHISKLIRCPGEVRVGLQLFLIQNHSLLNILTPHRHPLLDCHRDQQLCSCFAALAGEGATYLSINFAKLIDDLLHLHDHELMDLDDLLQRQLSCSGWISLSCRMQQKLRILHHLCIIFILRQQLLETRLCETILLQRVLGQVQLQHLLVCIQEGQLLGLLLFVTLSIHQLPRQSTDLLLYDSLHTSSLGEQVQNLLPRQRTTAIYWHLAFLCGQVSSTAGRLLGSSSFSLRVDLHSRQRLVDQARSQDSILLDLLGEQ
mmetsp:Transcript_38104/g.89265  ORF Transcript_38104/g.89265 Transcript_38104/m.89265 type:complete len:260 (-) Transcript_38104:131-910(-)